MQPHSYVLIDATTRNIRCDGENRNWLIFDNIVDAEAYLSEIRNNSDRNNTEIVKRKIIFEK